MNVIIGTIGLCAAALLIYYVYILMKGDISIMNAVIQYILYLAVLVILAIPLGAYIKKVMNGEKTFLSKILVPCENAVYKVMHINKDEQMNWKKYAVSVIVFSGIGLVFLFLLQIL